jgi:glycosyltransferase involved in cell wall biosynthesis
VKICAICPAYRRYRLLENLIACYMLQDHEDRHLLVCDDSGELAHQDGDRWEVLSVAPQKTLPDKYNLMARLAFGSLGADAVAVMEDDDVYFPNYLANHGQAMFLDGWDFCIEEDRWVNYKENERTIGWSHPSWAWVDGSGGGSAGPLIREDTGHAKLHGCLAISRQVYERMGGWPETPRMDFDLQMLARLRKDSTVLDPCRRGPSQYYFRWASTHMPHGQSYSVGPGDEYWLSKAQAAIDTRLGPVNRGSVLLQPQLDDETVKLIASPPYINNQGG